ncbi:MAG: AAA family ATPase [Rickettsiales bacterium]|jgi:shikimate kinase|nr:AAA family ATPase [Rickettsiales bacterium]
MEEVMHPSRRRTIVLIGMMGAGKSTTGFGLAQKLGIKFVDSDRELERLESRTVQEIFEQKGEEYFKELEKKIIKKILNTTKPQVLSVGGNSLDDDELLKTIKEKTISVFLDVDLDTLIKRVERRNNRPVLNGKDKAEAMRDIYENRYPIYSKSDIVVNTTYLNKDTTTNVIMQLISDFINNYKD